MRFLKPCSAGFRSWSMFLHKNTCKAKSRQVYKFHGFWLWIGWTELAQMISSCGAPWGAWRHQKQSEIDGCFSVYIPASSNIFQPFLSFLDGGTLIPSMQHARTLSFLGAVPVRVPTFVSQRLFGPNHLVIGESMQHFSVQSR